jgi:hypothetical protein
MSASGVRWLVLHCASDGCSGGPSRSSSQKRERCPDYTDVFVEIDVAEVRDAIANADGEPGGEM